MKLLIFGATGGSGLEIVKQALGQGHEVSAFVRNPDKMNLQHPRLFLHKGDALDRHQVEAAIPGHEAVMIALGMPARDKSRLRERSTRIIVDAMKKTGVTRLIAQSVLGINGSESNLNFTLKYLIIPLLLKNAFRDHAAQEKVITESGLDWTIVRPPTLTDGPKTGDYKHGFGPDESRLRLKVSRADVADFMLRQLADASYFHRTPGISY